MNNHEQMADMYPEWIPPCPKEEQAEEEWAEWVKEHEHDA